jgi:hypothetical protein
MEILTNGVKEVGMGMGMEWKGYLWLLYVFRILAFFILVRGSEVGIRVYFNEIVGRIHLSRLVCECFLMVMMGMMGLLVLW